MFHKIAGDWFGTNSISQVMKVLNSEYKPFEYLNVAVFNDGILKINQVIEENSTVL